MEEELFKEFVLVGDTALALQIGHRKSTDLDLVGKSEISHDIFLQALAHAGRVQTLKKSRNMLIDTLNDIKVDFVN